jgi:pimeloyl-ACP methyl ester carboxylesterase
MTMAIAALALLTACTSSPPARTVRPTQDPQEQRTFNLGAETMLPCTSGGYEAVCGDLQVPENRSDPAGRIIELKVVVIPATSANPAPDPVFFLTGGPGGAATQGWASAPSLFPTIHNDRDIVLVDQRGTGGSNELLLPSAPDVSGLSPAETRRTLERWAEGALDDLDGDLRFYTSAAAADDLDDVRAALGYDLIDLYGSSYGATLAQYYLRQHEGHVRAVVLDSGTLVDVPIGEVMAARSQEALDEVFNRCRADVGCHAAYPDPERDLQTALRRLSQHPVRTDSVDEQSGERIVLTADSLAGRVHELLKTGQSSEIPRLVHLAAEGDFDPLTQLVLAALNELDPTNLGMFWSIECFEAWAAYDPEQVAELGAGSYLLPVMLDGARDLELGCSLMPHVPTPVNDAEPVRSPVPVLLLNGSLDPQDPPANVADAPTELPNSLVIVAPEAHTFGHVGCMPDVVATFFEAATVEGLDTTCVDELTPPPFSTSMG